MANPADTTLTAFFKLSQEDEFAQILLYVDVPKFYIWQASMKKFQRRAQGSDVEGYPGIKSGNALGRVYTVHPNNFECYCLRLLLHHIRGPTSYAALKTVNGQVCRTYQEACNLLGLLEDDGHWNDTLEEAAATQSPMRMRNLFAIMIATCGLSNPSQLWKNHQESLSEDLLHQARREHPGQEIEFMDDMFNRALIMLEDKVMELCGKNLTDFGLPSPNREEPVAANRELLRETDYSVEVLVNFLEENEPHLVPDQANAYEQILQAIQAEQGGMIFLDAPGGTGKTFLINLLLAKVRHQGKIALAVASSGIAATLLEGGRTAHSTFKLPLNLAHNENPVCNIKKGSAKAKLLEKCSLIVWDECTMSHKLAFEALDRTLQDIRENDQLMGGITMVIAGDFRQTLPVIPRSTPADELNACLKASYLWRSVQTLTLSTNMRVHLQGDQDAGRFANLLLQIGNGTFPVDSEGQIIIPQGCGNVVKSSTELTNMVYPNIIHHYKDHKWLRERAILAPKNETVAEINMTLLRQLPGSETSFKSVDTVIDQDQAVQYPAEFLNSLEPAGMPPHHLTLKIGTPIMLLRNLEPPILCNGTRLVVKNMMPHVLEATILTGKAKGEDVFIPRIPLITTDLPFEFKRLQFPVKVSFAMTIYKSQGQSLKMVGLNLVFPCFSHGQFYVGCSRVGTGKNLYILAANGKTKNVVYLYALQ